VRGFGEIVRPTLESRWSAYCVVHEKLRPPHPTHTHTSRHCPRRLLHPSGIKMPSYSQRRWVENPKGGLVKAENGGKGGKGGKSQRRQRRLQRYSPSPLLFLVVGVIERCVWQSGWVGLGKRV